MGNGNLGFEVCSRPDSIPGYKLIDYSIVNIVGV